MKKGNECEILIEATEFPGYGIGVFEEEKIYVKNTVPGQKVKVRVTKKRKKYSEASLMEVLEDCNYSIKPECPHFGLCGGCTHQFVSYDKQLEFKKQQVLDLLEKANIEGFEFLGIEGSPEIFKYRNKMEFSFGDLVKDGELTLGMHVKHKAFSVVSVDECKIVDEDFNIILRTVLDYFSAKKFPVYKIMSREGYIRNLVVRKGKNTEEILINIVTTSQIDFDYTELTEILKSLSYKGILKGILHTINDSLADMVKADKIEQLYGTDYITERILGLNFKISTFSFFQTNSLGAEKLYSIVEDFLGDVSSKVVFDLYCGTGTIGQILAKDAKKVVGVELVEEAIAAANENAKLNGLTNCTFIAGDVANVIGDLKDKPDAIVLDPPRVGVHPKAMEYVIKFNAPIIVYVSCNPKSLMDDLRVLCEAGYKIEKIKVMDMFPHTPHVECVVGLRRENTL